MVFGVFSFDMQNISLSCFWIRTVMKFNSPLIKIINLTFDGAFLPLYLMGEGVNLSTLFLFLKTIEKVLLF